MGFSKCSLCNGRDSAGIASIYWAWYTIDHERDARRVQYCYECLSGWPYRDLGRSVATAKEDVYETCLGCGEAIDGSGAIIYGKLFAPKQEGRRFELWYCFKCFDERRSELGSLGVKLPDRQVASKGPLESAWTRLIELVPAS